MRIGNYTSTLEFAEQERDTCAEPIVYVIGKRVTNPEKVRIGNHALSTLRFPAGYKGFVLLGSKIGSLGGKLDDGFGRLSSRFDSSVKFS